MFFIIFMLFGIVHSLDVHISNYGNETNNGTFGFPLQSISGALKLYSREENIRLIIEPGIYQIGSLFVNFTKTKVAATGKRM